MLISTKTALPMGDGPNDAGTSRSRLIRTVEDALRLSFRGSPPAEFGKSDVAILEREPGPPTICCRL